MESIEQYFAREDTPSAGSPVGILMEKIVAKFPGISFDDARAKANDLLQDAAKRKKFTLPRVLSEVEQAQQREQLKAAFAKPSTTLSSDAHRVASSRPLGLVPNQVLPNDAQQVTSKADL